MSIKRGPEFKIEDEPVEIRLSYAKNPQTHPELLRRLSRDPFWFVRDYVACNISTPKECLEELSLEPDFRIWHDAEKTLKKLADNSHERSLSDILAAAKPVSAQPVIRNVDEIDR